MKLDTLMFAIASGILVGLAFAFITLATLLNIPGFSIFAQLLKQGYQYYGYCISGTGVIVGFVYGFIEGFIWLGAFSFIYNMLLNLRKNSTIN